MVGNAGTVDPWVGARAPKIKPEPIQKTWRHDEDPTRRRATFGVRYPLLEVSIKTSEDVHTKLPARFEVTKRRSVEGVRPSLQTCHGVCKRELLEEQLPLSKFEGSSGNEGYSHEGNDKKARD